MTAAGVSVHVPCPQTIVPQRLVVPVPGGPPGGGVTAVPVRTIAPGRGTHWPLLPGLGIRFWRTAIAPGKASPTLKASDNPAPLNSTGTARLLSSKELG